MKVSTVAEIPQAAPPLFEDCTVTSVSPLRIQRDCDSSPRPFTPKSLIAASRMVVGDRVRVDVSSGDMLVIGRNGGPSFTLESVVADADSLMLRDGDGRSQVSAPAAGDDVANKDYADSLVALMGNQLILPSGVAGGATLSLGEVTIPTVASFSVADCFPAAYDYVLFYLLLSASSGGTDIWLRMRTAAGADLSTGVYQYGRREQSTANGNLTSSWSATSTGAMIGRVNGADGARICGTIINPNSALYKSVFTESTDSAYHLHNLNTIKQATAYPSCTIYSGGPTMTGKMSFLGVKTR